MTTAQRAFGGIAAVSLDYADCNRLDCHCAARSISSPVGLLWWLKASKLAMR
ncbi:MAG: hypothetical protein U0075_22090 [Thermomicrobiales bacterium]